MDGDQTLAHCLGMRTGVASGDYCVISLRALFFSMSAPCTTQSQERGGTNARTEGEMLTEFEFTQQRGDGSTVRLRDAKADSPASVRRDAPPNRKLAKPPFRSL